MRRLPIQLFFTVLLFCANCLSAQHTVFICGHIRNAETGLGIDGAVVVCTESARSVQAGKDGAYVFKTPRLEKMKLEFRLLGYKAVERVLAAADWQKLQHDTLLLEVTLFPQAINAPNTVIVSQKTDTVFGTMRFFVEDFEFYGDQFVLLTFEKSLKKAQVKLADKDQKILTSTDIPDEALELYKDYQGYINVMCKEKIYRLLFKAEQIELCSLPVPQYRSQIMPCVDTTTNTIFFSNQNPNYPAFSWFSYRVSDSTVRKLKYVKDKDLLELYEEEFDFLKPRDRLIARKLEIRTGIDKRVIAAQMTGFPQSLYYTPVYAPLFVKKDTLFLFDHYSDRLFRFSSSGHLLDSVAIQYHHPKDWKEWKHKLLQDRESKEVYAVFQRGGCFVLKPINLHTGLVYKEFRLNHPYASHLKIRNGFVYYVYRPSDSGQTKFTENG
jgi:hypothetical protein